ncbi:P protein-like [Babylonia areolata]|uniref:P protein-like n=1 Tax=Babylonia areolata TaxID=304850 RepID=UPI003FD30EF9
MATPVPPPRSTPLGLYVNPSRTRATSVTPGGRVIPTPSSPHMATSRADGQGDPEETSPLLGSGDGRRAPSDDLIGGGMGSMLASSVVSEGQTSLSASLQVLRKRGSRFWLSVVKILVLFVITVLCCVVVVQHEELSKDLHEIVATTASQTMYSGSYDDSYPIMEVMVMGPLSEDTTYSNNSSSKKNSSRVHVVPQNSNDTGWTLRVNEKLLQSRDMVTVRHQFKCEGPERCNLSLSMTEDGGSQLAVPLVYSVHTLSTQVRHETIYAAVILGFVYVLIIFELVHRTLAAMLGALAALAVLSAVNQKPATETLIGWMDTETLMLLFGMMIMVAVVAETGIFDFCAFKAYQLARQKVWRLVTLLCVFSALVSAFLDNVTTILLLSPITIRLCEVLNLEPRVILIAEVLFSNIGGTATAIGDPPNVIIVGALEQQGITFGVFTLHMAVGVLFIAVAAYGFLRLYYRNITALENPVHPDEAELIHEIDIWRRAASRMVVMTREESLMRALFLQTAAEKETILTRIRHKLRRAEIRDQNEQFRQLERDCQIRDKVLLLKCGCVLFVVLLFFFMYSFVSGVYTGLGWIAVLGAIWLLVLADMDDLESILHKVEWSTLLFFAALFILMEALAELGLMEWIGEKMKDMIVTVDAEYRLTAALVIIVWISALASSFIDNIPFTTAMIPVLKQLCDDSDLRLELLPMVIALAMGACLGGNGTLIGASANVVCAGIADQHGYTISFKHFFKVGFPMMLVTTLVATVYLLLCHSAFHWNSV